MLINLLGCAIVLSIVVFVHEFGHYYAAIKCGVKVEEFSIGFGKIIYSFSDKNSTRWSIRLVPVGGFVKMHESQESHIHNAESFSSQTVMKRSIIVGAGPFANYLLAIVLLTSVYTYVGRGESLPIIDDIVEHSPADQSGLQKGDLILRANNIKISKFSDLKHTISTHHNQMIALVVERNGIVTNISVTPVLNSDNDVYIGIIGKLSKERNHNIIENFAYATQDVIKTSRLIILSIKKMLFANATSNTELGGIISIAKESGNSLSHSFVEFITFIAFLSINIGLLNLLPLPILDGGHLVLLLYEAFNKKPLHKTMQSIYYRSGIVIIFFLFIISTLNDITKLL